MNNRDNTIRKKVQESNPRVPGALPVSCCSVAGESDLSRVSVVELWPVPSPLDYQVALRLANAEEQARLGEFMLLSWYDRDRDFESPQHAGECHADSAVPAYVDYGIHHGARLKVDVEQGRFVFFYLPVDL